MDRVYYDSVYNRLVEVNKMGEKKKKDFIRIYEVYEGEAKPSNLYIDPDTGLVVVKKEEKKE